MVVRMHYLLLARGRLTSFFWVLPILHDLTPNTRTSLPKNKGVLYLSRGRVKHGLGGKLSSVRSRSISGRFSDTIKQCGLSLDALIDQDARELLRDSEKAGLKVDK